MKYIFALVVLAVAVAALPRMKRQIPYVLPDGAEFIVGPIQTTFKCEGLRFGYYADQANDCQVFHICNPVTQADGTQEIQQYSFYCGNQTIFDQLSLTCDFPIDAVSCDRAKEFYSINDRFGLENEFFLREEDLVRASKV